jgi:hypothetical protein
MKLVLELWMGLEEALCAAGRLQWGWRCHFTSLMECSRRFGGFHAIGSTRDIRMCNYREHFV